MKYDPDVRKKALEHIEQFGLAPTHKRLINAIPAGARVLDLGCATGYLSEAIAAKGCEVVGVEMDADAAHQAQRFCSHLLVGDAGDPDLLDRLPGTFDIVVCADILEHLSDPWTVLRILGKTLNPQGKLLVSLPNVSYWKMRFDLLRGRFNYTDTGLLDRTHLRFFTVNSFRSVARDCGYSIQQMIINDAGLPGFPHPVDWESLPKLVRWLVNLRPNLCVFHAIYTLTRDSGKVD